MHTFCLLARKCLIIKAQWGAFNIRPVHTKITNNSNINSMYMCVQSGRSHIKRKYQTYLFAPVYISPEHYLHNRKPQTTRHEGMWCHRWTFQVYTPYLTVKTHIFCSGREALTRSASPSTCSDSLHSDHGQHSGGKHLPPGHRHPHQRASERWEKARSIFCYR